MDGNKDDWAGVSTTFTVPPGPRITNLPESGIGDDIIWAGVATDGTRIYFAFETRDRIYFTRDKVYRVDLRGTNLVAITRGGNRNGDEFTGYHRVPNGNWNNSTWSDNSSYVRTRFGEIFEASFPLDAMDNWTESYNCVVSVQWFIQQNREPWQRPDHFETNIVLPTMEYRLTGQE